MFWFNQVFFSQLVESRRRDCLLTVGVFVFFLLIVKHVRSKIDKGFHAQRFLKDWFCLWWARTICRKWRAIIISEIPYHYTFSQTLITRDVRTFFVKYLRKKNKTGFASKLTIFLIQRSLILYKFVSKNRCPKIPSKGRYQSVNLTSLTLVDQCS